MFFSKLPKFNCYDPGTGAPGDGPAGTGDGTGGSGPSGNTPDGPSYNANSPVLYRPYPNSGSNGPPSTPNKPQSFADMMRQIGPMMQAMMAQSQQAASSMMAMMAERQKAILAMTPKVAEAEPVDFSSIHEDLQSRLYARNDEWKDKTRKWIESDDDHSSLLEDEEPNPLPSTIVG